MMQKRIWSCLVVAAVVFSVSLSVQARRMYETEYYISGNGVDGSVLYPCEGGQIFFWMDGVERTRAESLALLDNAVLSAAAYPVTINGARLQCVEPLGSGQHCAKAFDWNNVPTDFADAVSQCDWVQ